MELVAPIPGGEVQSDPEALTLDDFAVDERTGEVEACPQGHAPLFRRAGPGSGHDADRDAAGDLWRMPISQCAVRSTKTGVAVTTR